MRLGAKGTIDEVDWNGERGTTDLRNSVQFVKFVLILFVMFN